MPVADNIQWFPGHMTRTRRKIAEVLPLIDLVAEVRDARIPESSRNPDLAELVGGKPRICLLNKKDTADEAATARWLEAIQQQGTLRWQWIAKPVGLLAFRLWCVERLPRR